MTENLIELQQYREAKAGYQKFVEKNPHTYLTFDHYFKVKMFLEKLRKAKLRKKQESREEQEPSN